MKTHLVEMAGLSATCVGDGDATLVLMHGLGAQGDDLVPLADFFRDIDGMRCVFPEAPLSLPPFFGGGRAWWHIDFVARAAQIAEGKLDFSGDEPEGLSEARIRVDQFLDELTATQTGNLIVGGFSQGSMLALDLALRTERALAGLVILSGTLLCANVWVPLMAARSGLPVFQSHGRADPLLPFSMAEDLRDRLISAGVKVEWHATDGGHDIGPDALQQLVAFVRRCSQQRA